MLDTLLTGLVGTSPSGRGQAVGSACRWILGAGNNRRWGTGVISVLGYDIPLTGLSNAMALMRSPHPWRS